MSFSEIVNVNISRDTRAVQRAAFGTAMFLGRHAVFAERAQSYADLDEVLSAGFVVGTPEYTAAAAYFGSDITPTELLIGRQIPTSVILTPTVQNSTEYSVYVGHNGTNGTPVIFTYTSDASATAAEIATGLKALIDADGDISASVTTSDSGAVLTLTKASTDDIIVNSWSENLTATYTSTESLVTAIAACREENDTWYALATYSHKRVADANDADYGRSINSVAAYINAQKKIYGYTTGAAKATDGELGTGIAHIAGDLKAAARDRTFGVYDVEAGKDDAPTAATTYGEMGWLGRMLPTDPGAATWMFKRVPGLTIDNLTSTQSSNARDHNLNVYEQFQGQNMVWEGKMADGTYIDIVHGADWLEARLTERLFYLLLNNDKIPYTDAGVSAIEAEVRAQLLEGVAAGYITDDFTITVPKVSAVSANDKANRVLPAVKFVATLQGAVHSVTIQGRVQA